MEGIYLTIFIYIAVILQIILIQGEEELKSCLNIENKSKNPYFVGDGFTCCNNILLEHPLKPKNEHWRKCLSQQHGNPEDDIPTTMWNAFMCEVTLAGSISNQNSASYKEFESFFMKLYPGIVKKEILRKNTTCEGARNADVTTKLQRIEECFWKSEEQTCFEMAGAALINAPGTNTASACEPLDRLSKPNHSFMTFAQPCCKGQELPYPLFDIFMDFDRFDLAQELVTCSQKLEKRLKEISPQSILPFKMCEVACVHEADGLQGKYNSNFQELLNFKMKTISNLTKNKLIAKIAKYNPKFKLYGSNESILMTEAGEAIAKLDEASQILNYCKFQFEATAEAYRVLYEYCYNEEYGNQFREDILRSSSSNRQDGRQS